MLPLMRTELVDKNKWIADSELLDYFSLSQCTPGVIAVNVSTFCGYKMKGVLGAATATFAVVLPSLIVILSIASVLTQYMENPYVAQAFNGVRVVVAALILNVLIGLGRKNLRTPMQWGLFFTAGALIFFARFSPVMLVAAVLAFSVVQRLVKKSGS